MKVETFFCLMFATSTAGYSMEDWIDPHDMNLPTNTQQKLQRSKSENDLKSESIRQNVKSNTTPTVEESKSLMFLKRTINLILNSAVAEKDDPSLHTGSFKYRVDTDEHKFLLDFITKGAVSADDIRKLDTVFSEVFSRPERSVFDFDIPKDEIYNALFHTKSLILFAIIICFFIMFYLLKNDFGFSYVLSYFAFLMLIVDYGVRYQILYEEAEEQNLKLLYSEDCDISKMSWTNYLKFVMSPRDCERKIVTPLAVGLNQMKYIIIIPLESIGTGMGKFGNELWTNLPAPWNILIFPIMLIFTALIAFLFTMALKGFSVKLNFLHLLYLEFFGNRNTDGNRITGETHRPMVEDAKSSPDRKNHRWKNKNKTQPKKKEEKNSCEKVEVADKKSEKGGESVKNVKENNAIAVKQ